MMRGLFQRNKQDSDRQLTIDAGRLALKAEGILKNASSSDDKWHKEFRESIDEMIGKIQELKGIQQKRGVDTSSTINNIGARIREFWDVADEKGCAKPMIDADLARKLSPMGKPPQSI